MADPPAQPRGEFLLMWDTIVAGAPVGPDAGWVGPAQTRYTWDRLKARDKNGDGRITRDEFGGPADLFAALDRDGDAAITPDDLDWSDNSQYARQLGIAQQVLRRTDADGNKKLSREEWEKLFDELAKGKKALEAEDLRRWLFPPNPGRPPGGLFWLVSCNEPFVCLRPSSARPVRSPNPPPATAASSCACGTPLCPAARRLRASAGSARPRPATPGTD